MLALSLGAVRAIARRFVLRGIRAYWVPCGVFGRRAPVWDCAVLYSAHSKRVGGSGATRRFSR